MSFFFFFQAEDGIRDGHVTGVQTCALPIFAGFNGSREICELRKLFLLKESRGLGVGKALVVKCLEYARQKGYKECYLDTLSSMKSAIALYEKFGFVHLDRPLEGTIHNGCDVWMLKKLQAA